MKGKSFLLVLTLAFLPACDGWVYSVPTFPAPPPTLTPSIYTPTPIFLTATATDATVVSATPTDTALPLPSDTATAFTEAPTSTIAATSTPPPSPIPGSIGVEVLGCNTSIDLAHGMGEVTNAFVTLKNASGSDLVNLCATLFALDEGRVHPDKTVCLPALESNFQATLKLTVDSTYNKETPIQVEVKSGETLLARIGQASCKDIGLFAPAPATLLTPVAIP
ncbi:MAG: hypothetical protein Fur0043_06970 [Anaerolineales bacterium]